MSEQHDYRHSTTFAALKGLQETFDGNLSTVQYMRILDAYLYRSLAPIVNNTNHADKCLTQLLSWMVRNGKRKMTMDNSIDYQALIFQFLMTARTPNGGETSPRMKILRSMKMDRAALVYIVNSFVDALTGTYRSACDGTLPLPFGAGGDPLSFNLYVKTRIDSYHGIGPDTTPTLLALHQEAAFWRSRYLATKRVTLEKYVRLSIMNAQKDYAHYFSCSGVDLDDLSQSYLMMTSRAIDRCDPDQGTLTNLIQSWHLTGRSTAQKQRLNRQHEDLNVTTDDLEDDESAAVLDRKDDDRHHEIDHIRRVAEMADPKGFGRFLLGLLTSPPEARPSNPATA